MPILVDTLVDENDGDLSAGDLSLREAIANASPGTTINFDPSLAWGTITLTEGQLTIDKNLFINGLGADQLTISGNNASRVFLVDDGNENTSINVKIDGLTIADGQLPRISGYGAGIRNDENLRLSNVIVRNNEGGPAGTGISNFGSLKIYDSVIKENSNDFRGAIGGAGGIENFSEATLEIENSTISNNSSARTGAGIRNAGGILHITNSTISGNTIDAASSGSGGAGIRNTFDGTLTVNNSTVTNNEIVLNPDSNSSGFVGGGISVGSGLVSVTNTIVAGNNINSNGNVTTSDVAGSFNSNGNNLIGDLQGSTGFNSSEELTVPVDSVIDTTLSYNGGFTQTHALVANSPAIDAGSNSEDVTSDQRGVSRPFGSNPDIGAVEFVPLDFVSFITVDTLADENDGNLSAGDVSLREAIAYVSSGGTIDFDSTLAGGTITLDLGELVIDKDLSINNWETDPVTISGNNASRVFLVDDGDNSNAINVEIQGVTISDGNPSTSAQFRNQGGGIFNRENLTISDSTISNNTAINGAGINHDLNQLTIENSTINDNTSQFFGGGILAGANLSVSNSTISSNTAGNSGGGIWFTEPSGGESVLTVNNSTITANITSGNGGGIFNFAGDVIVNNSIIAGNTDSSPVVNHPDVSGDVDSSSYNLIGDGTGSTSFTDGVDGNQVGTSSNPIDPLIGPLQNNGGSTATHALLENSPAIEAGDPNFAPPPEFDQRGDAFPRVFDGNEDGTAIVDIGAVELIPDDNYEPNNTLETAYDITGDEKTWLEDIDGLGVANNPDWYKLETGSGYENLIINLQFTHADGDIDMRLYDASGNYITDADSETDNELIETPAPAGIYYLQVYPFSGSLNAGNTYDLWWDDVETL
jgi:CSLREA domain-containing protein